MDDYKKRLIELGDLAQTALSKCKEPIGILKEEKYALEKIYFLLGFIESLK